METKDKKVSNLILKVGKLRDLIEEGDLDKIYNKLYLFLAVKDELIRHCCKYVNGQHELDFNENDLADFSQEIYDYIKNFQQKFLYSKFFKTALDNSPIDDVKFKEISNLIGKEMQVDTTLREVYKTLAYFGLVIYLWSQTDSKKSFMDQITDCIRSFL